MACEYCFNEKCICQITIIPKSCVLCDSCNKSLSDSDFIANEDSIWFEGWLYCMDCVRKYKIDREIIMKIYKGDNLSRTDLAKPMEMRTW